MNTFQDTTHDSRAANSGNDVKTPHDFRAFLSLPSFWSPQYLGASAWTEHAPFAFWLTNELAPRRFVELGTHAGFSYFAFCQAIQAAGMETTCYAIDTWQGDEHAGTYDESVFEAVNSHNNRYYATFSRLVRSTFDEALPHFEDGSIDLLHVDGRHFYADVKYDFESWIPKLSSRAVVLFHDTNVRERNFGVFKYWAELSENHSQFEFFHGHGLGILGYGTDLPETIRALFAASSHQETAVAIRQAYSCLGSAVQRQYEAVLEQNSLAAPPTADKSQSDTSEAELAALRQQNTELAALCATQRDQLAQTSEQLLHRQNEYNKLSQELAASWTRLAELDSEAVTLRTTNRSLRMHVEWLEGQNVSLQAQIQESAQDSAKSAQLTQAIYASMSWKLTKPLRFVKRMLRLAARPVAGLFGLAPTAASAGNQLSQTTLPGFENLTQADISRIKAKFDHQFYLSQYPDIAPSGIDPFTHYMTFGWREGRDPAPNFCTTFYLQAAPDVQASDMNPFVHWVLYGEAERRPAAPSSSQAAA